ncbi:MAG TPA: hypothetical protein VEJ84_06235 [Acidimicrobiales bacterium]|nr:hypothetical protein [Acidimicrobiales bacterium]
MPIWTKSALPEVRFSLQISSWAGAGPAPSVVRPGPRPTTGS